MKKSVFTIAIAFFSYYSHAQSYLPLTAGSTNPLTGDLYINSRGLTNTGSLPYLQLTNTNTTTDNYSINASLNSLATGYGNYFYFNAPSGKEFYFNRNANFAGSVGIGLTSPVARLQVAGVSVLAGYDANIDPHGPAVDPDVLANTGQVMVAWNREGAPGEIDFIGNQGAGSIGGFAFYNHDNSNNETQLMWIQGNGNIAIGTKDPKGYKLAVNGSAIATSMTVKLNANWPDYVFKKGYQLSTLEEIKNYIDQNHHLPDMPSEQDVAKEGINLGEMNKLLTKKVEELTLYLIEKDHAEKEANEKIRDLQAQLNALSKKLDQLAGK